MFRSDDESPCAANAEALSASTDAELDPETRRRLDAHLERCDGCRRRAAELAELRRRTLVGPVPSLGPLIERIAPAQLAGAAGRRVRTRRVGLAAAALSLVVGLIVGVVTVHGGPTPGPLHTATPTAQTDPHRGAGHAGTTVVLVDDAPDRHAVVVDRGGEVRWVNDDPDIHHLVIRSSGARIDNVLDPAAAESVTFTEPGTFRFDCVIHPSVTGTVTVL